MNNDPTDTFLLQDEPPAFEIINAQGSSKLLLICDHASNRVPQCLQSLGLESFHLNDHIGWDPGAAEVARLLAKKLDAPLVLSGYSRLVIDCNRPLQSSQSIPIQSAGVLIPGNHHLAQWERDRRVENLFHPYHQAIEKIISERLQTHATSGITALLSIHSFTPFLFNQQRPWHIGISHKNHKELASLMFDALSLQPEIRVGFNQPYPIEDEYDYSIPSHGDGRNLASAMIEIRQDGINTPAGIETWAEAIAKAYRQIKHSINILSPTL